MGRCIKLDIHIDEVDASKVDDIVEALSDIDLYEGHNLSGETLTIDSQIINLPHSCSEEDTAKEIKQAVWEKHGKFCPIQIFMLDLDEPDGYIGYEEEYDEMFDNS